MPGETLLLVNPRRRRRKSRSSSRRRKSMPAGLKRYWAAKRAGRSSSRLSNPRRRHRRSARRTNPVSLFRRRRRNPSLSLAHPLSMVKPALIGGAGALAVNAAVNYLVAPNLPSLVQGRVIYATKFGLALLLGTFGRRFLGQHAVKMAEGAMTVIAATALNDLLLNTAGVNLSGIGYYSPAMNVSAPGFAPRLAGVKPVLTTSAMQEQARGPLDSPRLGLARIGAVRGRMGMYVGRG